MEVSVRGKLFAVSNDDENVFIAVILSARIHPPLPACYAHFLPRRKAKCLSLNWKSSSQISSLRASFSAVDVVVVPIDNETRSASECEDFIIKMSRWEAFDIF